MALSENDYAEWVESIEQTLSAHNLEIFKTEHPEEMYPDWPDPTYAQWLATSFAEFRAALRAESVVTARLTTGSSGPALGRATVTYPAMTTPVVVATVLDATFDTTYFHVVLESVASTSATVRVVQNTSAVVLGISLLTVPQLAASAPVHVMVYDAG